MEYFKKLQCYKPNIGYINAPVRIEEIALLQDSENKNVYGRVKFINQSRENIIGIFINLKALNIAGEIDNSIKSRCIYQDMVMAPGDIYGNKVAIALPNETRKLEVTVEKVVFENELVWDANIAEQCEIIHQDIIEIPEKVLEKIRQKLSVHLSNMEYVQFFYEDSNEFWECTCGKINSTTSEQCTFCANTRDSQKQYLTKLEFNKLITDSVNELQQEQEEKEAIEREEKRLKQIEYDKKRNEEEKQKEIQRELFEEQKKRRKKRNRIIFVLSLISIICLCLIGYRINDFTYNKAMSLYNSGQYEEAISKWNMVTQHKDSISMIDECYYQMGEELLNEGKYDLAKEAFGKCIEYKDLPQKIIEVDKKEVDEKMNQILQQFADPTSEDAISVARILSYSGKTKEEIEKITDFVFSMGDSEYWNLYKSQWELCGRKTTVEWYLGNDDNKLSRVHFVFPCTDAELDIEFAIGIMKTLFNRNCDEMDDVGYPTFKWNQESITGELALHTVGDPDSSVGYFLEEISLNFFINN